MSARPRLLIACALALYAAGFCIYWPNAILVADEASYVGQAVVFAHGRLTAEVKDPLHGRTAREPVSTYQIGTSALQTPFVAAFGWRGAPLASLFCLIGAVLVLMRWLEREGRSPLFSLLLLLYPPALVLGRLGMSDVPSALVVTLGLLCFWQGLDGRRWAWLAAGFLAGASTLWREPNVLFFVPLFAGAVLRRERGWWRLVAGGLCGLSLRVASSWLVFGSPFYLRGGYGHDSHIIANNLMVYLFALVVMVPGGLLGLLLYRGRRRPEVISTGLLVLGFYTFYGYGAQESAGLKQLILGPRYFIPLVPLLAFAMAESLPRLLHGLRWNRAWSVAAVLVLGVESLAMHATLYRWGAVQASMLRAIERTTSPNEVLIVNGANVKKLLSAAFGEWPRVYRDDVTPDLVARLVTAGPVALVLLDRTDSAFRLRDASLNATFERSLRRRCDLRVRYDRQESAFEHLRISEVTGCHAPAPNAALGR